MTNCVICTETLGDCPPIQCGHIVHLECLKKQFRPECPLCRAPLDIEVSGQAPQPYLGYDEDDESSRSSSSSREEEEVSSSSSSEESSSEENSSNEDSANEEEYKDSYGQIWFNGHCIGDWATQRTLVIERLAELEKKAKSLRESLEAIPEEKQYNEVRTWVAHNEPLRPIARIGVRCEGTYRQDGQRCTRFITKPENPDEKPLCWQHKGQTDPSTGVRCEERVWQGQRQCSRFVLKPEDPDEKPLCWQHKKTSLPILLKNSLKEKETNI